jgi:hypothetical protein
VKKSEILAQLGVLGYPTWEDTIKGERYVLIRLTKPHLWVRVCKMVPNNKHEYITHPRVDSDSDVAKFLSTGGESLYDDLPF